MADASTPNLPVVLAEAVRRGAGTLAPAGRLAFRMAMGALTLRARNRQLDSPPPPSPLSSPRTALAARIGRERSVGLAHIDRADVDEVRQATGVTVNDVILYVSGVALRNHLLELGQLPDRAMTAFVPKSTRADADTLETGVNRLSGMLVSLATDIEDPVARLLAVADSARAAKEQERILGEDLFGELCEIVPPMILGPAATLARRIGITVRRPPFSVVVSSFPGSPAPLYCAGAELVAYHPFGPVVDGSALNITAASYRDSIGFGLLACRNVVPPPQMERLSRRVGEAMTELSKALANCRRRRSVPGATDRPRTWGSTSAP